MQSDEHILHYIAQQLRDGEDPAQVREFLRSRHIPLVTIRRLFAEAEQAVEFETATAKHHSTALFDVALLILFLYNILLQALSTLAIAVNGWLAFIALPLGMCFGYLASHLLHRTGAGPTRIARLGFLLFPSSLPFVLFLPALFVQYSLAYAYLAMVLYYFGMNGMFLRFHQRSEHDLRTVRHLALEGLTFIMLLAALLTAVIL
ncbi:hypothetical protein COY28_04550 [Candidatus Woesearchaeota archaeon CG_4_10_14_0_2_um_filter_57_5]|nr:MAG: hypothetical protein COY28_04550 [Candidatus Woesearchaeota archaeon CG_4_10_14_0_2_um_filter_57_5]